ncbi:response regulator [Microcoleus sp. FACHB-1515]|uniref:response regulator n=1 Tax=Cyanophyceae TaxID=3028117 RepID=UPI0018F0372D|nr:response regulator [Microcoleus sp. FACHB-1515]
MIRKILVVDDEADLRNLVQTCLEIMGGWQVVTAGSGEKALQEAQNRQLDLILLDLMMPKMDGLAILEQLRSNEKTRQIPIVLLTAKGRSIESAQFEQFNVLGMIRKPFNPVQLADQIEALLSNIRKA